MRLVPARFAVLAAALSATSCGGLILNANFDDDALGGPPSMMPAGDPADDRVFVLGPPFGADAAEVVVESGFDGRALAITRVDSPLGISGRAVQFISTEETGKDTVIVSGQWRGRLFPEGGSGSVQITLKDAASRPLHILRLRGNTLERKTSWLGSSYVTLGTVPTDVAHTFILTANIDALGPKEPRYEGLVLVSPLDGTSDPIVEVVPLLIAKNDSVPDVRVVQLEVAFQEDGAGPERYVIDTVQLKRDPPETPKP